MQFRTFSRGLAAAAVALALVTAAIASNISGGGGGGGGGTPGGSNTQLQYNNSAAFGGIAGATTNGTTVTFANSDLILGGSSTGVTTFSSANAGASNFTTTVPANTGTLAELNLAETFSAAQTFNSGDLIAAGATSGNLTINCAAVCGTNTVTFPANTGTVGELNLAQTWSAAQNFNSGDLIVNGATSGALTINCAAVCGSRTLTFPAGTTDFSSTGGAHQVVEQTSSGGAFTVAQLACADLSNSATGCSNTSANPSATIGLAAVNGSATTYMTSDSAPALSQAIAPTWTGAHTFSGKPVTLSGNQSVAAWTTTGTGLLQSAATYTDTSTGVSGTVADSYINKLGAPTIAASNAGITYTRAYNLDIEPPAAGTNVTVSNPFSARFQNAAVFIGSGQSTLCASGSNRSGSAAALLCGNPSSYLALIGNDGVSGTSAGLEIYTGSTSQSAPILQLEENGTSTSVFSVRADGSVQIAGPNFAFFKTAPTISSGFGTSPSIVSNNGTVAFQVNVGTGGTATSGVIGLPTATNGWAVGCADVTTESATVFITRQTASTTTTATVGNFNTSGAAAAWVASDKLNCTATAF